ncbi:MAG: AAA family ATPase [Desulfamplus sp.]|nr:AAA family ATPase [Desulfamplus sp.]
MQEKILRKEKLLHKSTDYIIHIAIHDSENKKVILKEPLDNSPNSPTVARLSNEFKLGKIIPQHENIIQYIDIIKKESQHFLIREYYESINLKDFIAHENFEMDGLLTIALQIAEGLSEIHRNNIIHRLLKPSNILINPKTKQVKISDFGMATYDYETTSDMSLLIGSVAYISPEQTGRMNRMLDYRTDFYSFGIILYEMLTRRLPFDTVDAMEMVHCHIAKPAKPPHEINVRIPEAVSQIVMKMLEKAAEHRYQSAHGLKNDLIQCLDQLRSKGAIKSFPLGSQDLSAQLLISQKIYGRESEIQAMIEAFERICAGKVELMLIAGYAGVGKTVLVNELYKPVIEKKGFFISGKFDQYTFNLPYYGIAMAFRLLMQHLLTEPENQIRAWKQKLTAAIGDNGQVIIDIIPELVNFIDVQPELSHVGPIERRNRCKIVFQAFIQAFSQKEHPLVVFLDDLQWVDPASLELLEDIIISSEAGYLMIIGAFRENEVPPEHPLLEKIGAIRREHIGFSQLTLNPLDSQSLNRLLVDTFSTDFSEIEDIGILLIEKTGGNPFFVNQFLKSIHESKLLRFNFAQSRWTWDNDKIVSQNITDNVAALMIQRLRLLPDTLQRMLQLAACLGHTFDLKTLSSVLGQPSREMLYDLSQLIKTGFILPLGGHYKQSIEQTDQEVMNSEFKFLHDRVQQAAYDLIPVKQKNEFHLSIGRLIIKTMSQKEVEDTLFNIIKHLNHGRNSISDEEKIQLAEFNLSAGLKAKRMSAYGAALQYISIGMTLLPENCWQLHHELTFQLYKNRAELEYLNNNLTASDKFIGEALCQKISDIKRAEFYNQQIILNTMLANYKAAVEIGENALALLGMQLAGNDLDLELQNLIAEIDNKVSVHEISGLINHQAAIDPKMLIMIKIMANMLPLTFLSNQKLYRIIAARSVLFSIVHGHTPESSICYSGYGILLVSMGDYQTGFDFGMLALKISQNANNYSQTCKAAEVLVAHLNHWINPIRQFQGIALAAYEAAEKSGEIQFAGYAMKYAIGNFLFMGRELSSLQEELYKFLSFCIKTQNQIAVDVLKAYHYFFVKLTGEPSKGSYLTIEDLNEDDYLKKCHDHQSVMAICIYHTLQCQYFYFSGHYKNANKYALSAEKLFYSIPGSITLAQHLFYSSLTLTALFHGASEEDQKAYLKELDDNLAKLNEWNESCPENFSSIRCLIGAEIARINERDMEAMDLYDQAIASAHEQEFMQNEAIANELCAIFWMNKGKEEFADLHLKKAHACYLKWGAKLKVKELEKVYPQIFLPSENISTGVTYRTNGLDISAIIKGAQAISSEIDLKSLILRIMTITIQNAGAQKGALILEQDQELVVVATVDADQILDTAFEPILVESSETVSPGIINYVKRTGEVVVIGDASSDKRFRTDDYIRKNHPKSILCKPIVQSNRSIGIIYLENNLAINTFTDDRLQVADFLASQAGISLINARLFEEKQKYAEELFAESVKHKQTAAALRKEQAFTDKALNAQNDTFFLFDPVEGKAIRWNQSFKDITGYTDEEIATLKAPETYYSPQDLEKAKRMTQKVLAEGFGTVEMELICKNGRKVPTEYSASVINDEQGNSKYFISIGRDVSERKKTEEKLQHVHKMEAIGTLAGGIAHDFNNLLSVITGNISYALSQVGSNEELHDVLRDVQEGAKQAQNLTQQLLTFAKGGEPIKKAIQLNPLVQDSSGFVLRGAKSKCEYHLAHDLWNVEADSGQLHQVISNLVINADQAMPNGGIITIQTDNFEVESGTDFHLTAGKYVKISIRDQGVGIQDKYIAHIFDPYFTTKQKGSGLGLATAYSIIKRHGGHIAVYSEMGKGTIFHIYLSASIDSVHESKKDLNQKHTGQGKILIMDDQEAILKMAGRILNRMGYTTEFALDGSEAIKKYCEAYQNQNPFNLVILDLTIPGGMGGTKTIIELLKIDSNVKAIVSSGYSNDPIMSNYEDYGFCGVVPKPYTKTQLSEVLNKIFGNNE